MDGIYMYGHMKFDFTIHHQFIKTINPRRLAQKNKNQPSSSVIFPIKSTQQYLSACTVYINLMFMKEKLNRMR